MFKDTIKELCKENKISVAKLERDAGLNQGAVKKWEQYAPNLRSIYNVSKVLGVSIDSICQKEWGDEQ